MTEHAATPSSARPADFKASAQQLPDAPARDQAARCMDCGTPFCHAAGCPLHTVIPEIHALVRRGRWDEALDLLLSTHPFPEFTARICPAPCQGACVLGVHAAPVAIRDLELVVTEKGFASGRLRPRPPARRRAERVAIVGSGPAGLAAADRLNRAGCQVVVYEDAARPGGILRYGIPDFKLDKGIVDRRIRLMQDEGIVFEPGVNVGEDVSLRFLQGHFHAVLLACGARMPRDLPVPGRDLAGIHLAMDYLVQQNQRLAGEPVDGNDILAGGKQAIVIGGGHTGADCVGTALRQGALGVLQFEILPQPPAPWETDSTWPMRPNMPRPAGNDGEGTLTRWAISATEFQGRNGRVEAVRTCDVQWHTDDDGRPRPRTSTGTESVVPADLVILALGFTGPPPNRIVEGLDLKRDAGGCLIVDADHRTSAPGVFAAGDMATGQSLVVRAIADGRAAAEGILRCLGAREAAAGPLPHLAAHERAAP